MLILTLRTDKPEAELGLFDGQQQLTYRVWSAHRQLAETIHQTLQDVLTSQNKQLADIQAIVMYQGPGSFTGLRIGLSVGNALAMSYGLPVSGQTGDDWRENGIAAIMSGADSKVVLPEYGAPVHITQQKK